MSERTCSHCGKALTEGDGSGICPRCAFGLALDADAPTEGGQAGAGAPPRIARYEPVERIGEGGMGEVWLATQTEPVRREVAIKLVKHGMDSRAVLARFAGERQALAMMDHPAVARVYDAGTTEDGRPYFVMEYVPGEPITDYCDRHRMPTADRLELFCQVCAGVQHAHQKAILHRDIKPSNVLVTEIEGRPHPKIIDFGVAKALDQQLTERTLFTELGVLLGTPEYMSPEQANAGADDVDTRTDIYSLGVLLYELLVGALPFASEELRAAGYEQLRRMIREREPLRPSARVSSLHDSPSASHRRTDPGSLERQLRGDLDWITMRALDKAPDRRYASCAELAADIRRHLASEPVLAGPPSAAYRARKFVRRHRAAVAVAALVLALLIAGLGTSTALWRIAAEERRQVLRLADLELIRDYSEDAERLWPARPEIADELRRWLEEKGRPLAERLPLHRQTLEALRATALPYDEAQQAADREANPVTQYLIDARESLIEFREALARNEENYHREDREDVLEHFRGKVRDVEAYIAENEPKADLRSTWKFPDAATQWQHETLTDLVDRLTLFADPGPFVGVIGSIEQRFEHASTVKARSIDAARAAWHEAISALGEHPQFEGVELVPQIGLVPLGADPASGLWEFWHVGSGDRPPSEGLPAAESGIVFVLVPGGSFWIGAQNQDPNGRNYDPAAERRERPPNEISLAPFFMSKYELTQAQWERMTGVNPSRFTEMSEWGDKIVDRSNPLEMVSWHDAMLWAERYGLVVPSEAQWEYAARAGTSWPWWTGAEKSSLTGAVNLQDAFFKRTGGARSWTYEEWLDDGHSVHAPVGTYRANPFGLHEMLGNVSEWTRDSYTSPYRHKVDPVDGYRHIPGGTATRVVRGGNYRSEAQHTRVSARNNITPDDASRTIGLRLARRLDATPAP